MSLRDDEFFTIEAIAACYGGTWSPGENPPDAYLELDGVRIAVEISTVMQHVRTDTGTHSRWSDDIVAIHLANELNDMLGSAFPPDTGVTLALGPPMYDIRRTKKALADLIQRIIVSPPEQWVETEVEIAGNTITVHAHQHWGNNRKKVVGLVLHRHSHPNILQNVMFSLGERIAEKTISCERVTLPRPLWLALLNDYGLADEETYALAYERLSPVHVFDRILLIAGNKKVTTLYDRSPAGSGSTAT